MTGWINSTDQGPIAAHIAQGKVAIHEVVNVGEKSRLILSMTPDQALEMARGLEQVAYELQRRDARKRPELKKWLGDPDLSYLVGLPIKLTMKDGRVVRNEVDYERLRDGQ